MKKKLTIADIAEVLGKKKAKYEKLANSKDKFENNTAKIKLGSINNLLDQLFQHQEAIKPVTNNNGLPKAKYGWPPNYWEIGDATNYMVNTPENPYPNPSMDLLNEYVDRARAEANSAMKSGEKFMNREANKVMPNKQFKNTQAGQALSNPNVQGGIIQGVGILADYINQMQAIKKMQEPNKVALAPRVKLNKNMDTSDLKRQAIRALRTSQMQANQTGNSNVSNAVRSDLLGAYFNQLGSINTAENNYRSQMENQEAQLNAGISMRNAEILNELYSAQNQFANNRISARSNAFSTMSTKGQMMAKDYRDQYYDMNVRLPLLRGGFNQQTGNYTDSLIGEYLKKNGYKPYGG